MARIDHYEFGRIVIDGRQETNDLIILPDRVVRNWWRQNGHALVLDDLVEVLDDLLPTWSSARVPTAACGPIPTRSGSSSNAG
jgi:hypothetical protein